MIDNNVQHKIVHNMNKELLPLKRERIVSIFYYNQNIKIDIKKTHLSITTLITS